MFASVNNTEENMEALNTPTGLAKLRKAGDTKRPPPIVTVYGTAGVGKSTFGANMPTPLFLDVEGGLGGLAVDSIRVESFGDVIQTLKDLHADQHGYKTLVIDTLDAFEPLLWAEASRRNGWSNIEEAGYGKGYIAAAELWRTQVIAGVQSLRDRHGMSILLLAHHQIRQFQSPTHETFDRYQLRLHKAAADLVVEFSDIVGFAHHDVRIKKETGGFNRTRARAIGDGSRILALEERPAAVAKNRFSMPAEIEFSAEAFLSALTKKD